MRLAASSLLLGVSSLAMVGAVAVPADAPSTNAAQYFVRSLPGQPEGPLIKMHAGCVFVPLSHQHQYMAPYLYLIQTHILTEKKTDTSKSTPLVTGTCSSGISRISISPTDSELYSGSMVVLDAAAWMGRLWRLGPIG